MAYAWTRQQKNKQTNKQKNKTKNLNTQRIAGSRVR